MHLRDDTAKVDELDRANDWLVVNKLIDSFYILLVTDWLLLMPYWAARESLLHYNCLNYLLFYGFCVLNVD